jgi:hypothetical protein
MVYKIGKYYNYMKKENIDKYQDIHGDILWYLLDVTKVNRFFTQNSFREFLTRYFLITKHDLTQSATDFIDHGILISGTLETDYFEFTLSDLIHFIGFSKSDRKFNVDNYLSQFISEYNYKELIIKYEQTEDSDNININHDTLALMLLGLGNLFKIDSLSIEFKKDLKNSTEEDITDVTTFVDYIISEIPNGSYIDQMPEYKGKLDWMEECYDSSKKVVFEPYTHFSREILMKIAMLCQDSSSVAYYNSFETMDEDFKSDFSNVIEHIVFAYGVKHGYIQLSTDQSTTSVIYDCYDPYFEIDLEIINEEELIIPTQFIYDDWKMEQWIDLLP